jgi:hypothetical protein
MLPIGLYFHAPVALALLDTLGNGASIDCSLFRRDVGMATRGAPRRLTGQARASSGEGSGTGQYRRRNRQRGGGRLKAIIWLVIVVAGIYAGVKIIPVLVTEYQFQDFMQTTARFASVNRMTTVADIDKSVLEEAKKEDIPLMPENVHVTADSGLVNISADYSVTVDLTVYQLVLNFHPAAGNKPLT